ncbi:hypothetical protein [Nocardioides sp. SYSU DS0663]|uniref:hypothetical protein n=1 Tax=Nocardioides sp. SYSU DS0663 TaxID=3416445 RepID=UPI003F4C2D63
MTALASLGLLAASLGLLAAGGFVQLDDTSGFGSDQWDLTWGGPSAVAAAASLAIALVDRRARRSLGAALAVLDGVLVGLSLADDGFRFIWHAGEGELLYLQVGLGLVALALLTPQLLERPPADDRPGATPTLSAWARAVAYLVALVIAVFAAFSAGTSHFTARNCGGPDFGGECDVAVLEGLLWVAVTAALGLLLIGAAERVRWRRRQQERQRQLSDSA